MGGNDFFCINIISRLSAAVWSARSNWPCGMMGNSAIEVSHGQVVMAEVSGKRGATQRRVITG